MRARVCMCVCGGGEGRRGDGEDRGRVGLRVWETCILAIVRCFCVALFSLSGMSIHAHNASCDEQSSGRRTPVPARPAIAVNDAVIITMVSAVIMTMA